ncbi:uncharacterized protein F5147DRAFT_762066, partial [Suillus discolor]
MRPLNSSGMHYSSVPLVIQIEFQSLSKEFGSLDTQLKLVSILRKLGHGVVGPIVQALRVSNIRPGSRIW